MHMGNEGKLIAIVPSEQANKAVEIMKTANTAKMPRLSAKSRTARVLYSTHGSADKEK